MKRRWEYRVCGRFGTSKIETRIVFHECQPPKQKPGGSYARRAPTLDDAWLEAFAEFRGGARPPTRQEAKTETATKRRYR